MYEGMRAAELMGKQTQEKKHEAQTGLLPVSEDESEAPKVTDDGKSP